MRKFNKINFWLYLIIGVLMVIAGTLMIIYPAFSITLLFKIIGIVFEVSGCVSIIMYFVRKKYDSTSIDLFTGAISILFGFPLIIATESMVGTITIIAGLVIGLFSIGLMFFSLFIRRVTKNWIPLFIISVVSFGLSIIVVMNVGDSLGILFGISLIVLGALMVAILIFLHARIKQMKKTIDELEKMNNDNQDNQDNNVSNETFEGTINE